MRFAFHHALSRGALGRACGLLPALLLSTAVAAIALPARAAEVGDAPATAQPQPSAEDQQAGGKAQSRENAGPAPSAPPVADRAQAPSAAPDFCAAVATAAAANDLPVDFLTRLIWQESRFKPDAISPKGAQGIAQFMPATARSNGLADPFDAHEAIAKSGQLLGGLRREFGNLGLAAAAYNAGSGRVHDWLGGRRPLPGETRAYVRIVTGRPAEDWAASQTGPAEMPSLPAVPCNLPATAERARPPEPSASTPDPIKPWGVEVVGGPTPAKALARYHEWQPKYAAILAGRAPHVVVRGIIGAMGAARVRVGEDTRAGAAKLCAALRAAGTYCDVMRN